MFYVQQLIHFWLIFFNFNVYKVRIRSGVVIGRRGGMIKSLKPSFFLGAGSFIGEGKQPLPWIHIEDLCQLIKFAVENKNVNGVLNGVAPDIITNADFTGVREKNQLLCK